MYGTNQQYSSKQLGNDSSFEEHSKPDELTDLKNLGDFHKVKEARQHGGQGRVQLTLKMRGQGNMEVKTEFN